MILYSGPAVIVTTNGTELDTTITLDVDDFEPFRIWTVEADVEAGQSGAPGPWSSTDFDAALLRLPNGSESKVVVTQVTVRMDGIVLAMSGDGPPAAMGILPTVTLVDR